MADKPKTTKLKLNLRDVKAGLDPIPPGDYEIEVLAAEIRIGKESGQPYLWLHTKILHGEWEKRRLFVQHTLNQESDGLNITVGSLNALLRRDISGDAKFELNTDDLVGLGAIAKVKWEKGREGEDRERVQYLKPLEGDAAVKADEAEERPW